VSPKRAGLRANAAAALGKKADVMKRRAAARDGVGEELPVETVVHLAFADVDRAKLDHTNATLVVVESERGRIHIAWPTGRVCTTPLSPAPISAHFQCLLRSSLA
jgi:hypothetical protein